MLEIKNLGKGNKECVPLLKRMFLDLGIKPIDPNKEMEFWSVESSTDSLLNDPVLSKDELGNELRAVYFITRKQKSKKTELFRFTELFSALEKTEANTTIQELIDYFLTEKSEYIAPIAVVCLGKINEDNWEYSGCFLYNIPFPVPIIDIPEDTILDSAVAHVKKIKKNM